MINSTSEIIECPLSWWIERLRDGTSVNVSHLEYIKYVHLSSLLMKYPTAVKSMYETPDKMEVTRCKFKVSRKDFVEHLIPYPEKTPEYVAKYPVEDTSKDNFVIEESEFENMDEDLFDFLFS